MADETNNRNAVFKFYLNRQGVKGNKGEKGDQGFSPVIEVSENTANSYKLQITTETDQFETPNLRGDEIDTSQSGTYVRYNEETQQMYVAPADIASTLTQGEVTLASGNDVLMLSETKPITPAGIVNNYAGLFVSTDGSINISQDEISEKINLKANTSGIEGDISALAGRVSADEQLIQNNTLAIGNKVDKVTGKGLSTNDFTSEDKDKLTHAVIDTDLADVAFTGEYADLRNAPTPYSASLGININTANQISVKVDGTTVAYNLNGELTSSGGTVDQTFNAASTNAQSGVAISNAKFLRNEAQYDSTAVILKSSNSSSSSFVGVGILGVLRGHGSVAIGSSSKAGTSGVAVGSQARTSDTDASIAVGYNTEALGAGAIAIGTGTSLNSVYAGGANSIQIGTGRNSSPNTLQVGDYQLLNTSTGFIPAVRIPVDGSTITINSSGQLVSSGGGAVDSVNGQTGIVVLNASDVGALATSDVTEYTAQEVETLWGSI